MGTSERRCFLVAAAGVLWGFSPIASAGGECALFVDGFEGRTWFVNASAPAGGDGSTWPTAFNDLQSALTQAQSTDTVWMAGGTYKPVAAANPAAVTVTERAATFELVSGISILGGFTPDNCRGGSRGAAVTTLSGDVAGDDQDSNADGITDAGLADNSYHVLTADAVDDVVLDGLTVRGGVADGQGSRSGGGLLQEGGSLALNNVEFAQNHSGTFGSGAGFANLDGVATLSDVRFTGNNATGSGGGMYASGDASVRIEEGRFVNNRARGNGGGAFLNGGFTARLHDVHFEANQVDTDGGGNGNGGGLAINGGSTTLSRAQFLENEVSQVGGGLNVRTGQVRASHAVFYRNVAGASGGGIFVSSQGPQVSLAYGLIIENEASNGGGIYTRGQISLAHSTIASNAASSSGGGLYVLSGGDVYTLNSIIWDNTAGSNAPGARTTADTIFARSVLQDSGGSPWAGAPAGRGRDGAGNLDVDPIFVDSLDPDGADDIFGTADDGYALQAGSPVRDLGTTADLADFDQDGSRREDLSDAADADNDGNANELASDDLAGLSRRIGHRVDFGAYEYQSPPATPPSVLYVDASAAPGGDGSSWGSAFDTLTDALAVSAGGQEIWVASGTYLPGDERADSFFLQPAVKVYGGFNGSETARAQRNADPETNATELSGAILTGSSEDNSTHVVTAGGVGPDALLDGFTISNGYADDAAGTEGAGIYSITGAPTLTNLIVRDNEAFAGGGAYNGRGAQPRFINVHFFDNIGWQGGGMHNADASVQVIGSHFLNNDGGGGGGGIYNHVGSRLVISHSVFEANEALRSLSSPGPGGGGIFNSGASEAAVQQVVFVGNQARHGGGLSNFNNAIAKLNHVTFHDNTALRGGAITAWNSSELSALNTIFWDNKLDTTSSPGNEEASEIYAASSSSQGGTVNLMNAIVDGGVSGPNVFVCGTCEVNDDGANSGSDPLFTDAGDPDGVDNEFATDDDGLTLGPGSGALNAGASVDAYDIDEDGSTTDPLADFTDADNDGNYTEAVGTDVAGGPRVQGAGTDIGAYEADP